MRVLVTGADGFVGEHLVRALLKGGHEVVGAITRDDPTLLTLGPEEARSVEWRRFDLRDGGSVASLVSADPPDAVVHLAALSSVRASWTAPVETFEVNVLGTVRLLDALGRLPAGTDRRVVLLVGSAEAYGVDGTEERPLTEDAPLRPLNPYGASKAAQEAAGWAYARSGGLRVVQTRSFNHAGPGQRPTFVLADWALQLLRRRAIDSDEALRVGNIEVRRDFLDVRDVADAYISLLETPAAEGVFNVCSGQGHSLRELLAMLCDATGVEVEVEVDPGKLRPGDIGSLVGDPTRLARTTGWMQARPMEQTLTDLVAELSAREDRGGAGS